MEVPILFTSLGLLGSSITFWTSWYLFTHKRWLVFCADRVQYRVGKCVRWEVRYREVAQIALFRGWLGALCLGVRLSAPERFDRAWPHLARERAWWQKGWGFDLALPTGAASEPPERVLETALRRLHHFRTAEEERDKR